MNVNLIGIKRERDNKESKIYEKIKTPDISTDKINYFLSQIKSEYEEGINYSFSFQDKLEEDIVAICLWGCTPLYEGRILNFTKQVKIEQIAKWANMGGIDKTFDFFANIQSLFYIDKDTNKKLAFFDEGKYGYIYEGQKDYYLIIHIKSLKKFNYIDKNNEYCQYWLLKITDKHLLKMLDLKHKNPEVNAMEKELSQYNKIIEEKDRYFEGERKEYVDRINKLIKDKEKECLMLKEKYDKDINEKIDLIEKFKLDKMNKMKRAKKFIGLKIISESLCIKKEEQNNIVSIEEFENEEKEDDSFSKEDFFCILCCIRRRDIFFDKCHHCCICEQCLEKCYHKFNKKTKQNEYFCPVCNNDTQKDDKDSFTETKKIIFV
jgi:hypothetical protein